MYGLVAKPNNAMRLQMPIDFICPLFVLSSVIIYVVIIVMVKKTLVSLNINVCRD